MTIQKLRCMRIIINWSICKEDTMQKRLKMIAEHEHSYAFLFVFAHRLYCFLKMFQTNKSCFRCLLSRDFVRIGKWFVQPYEGSEKIIGKR